MQNEKGAGGRLVEGRRVRLGEVHRLEASNTLFMTNLGCGSGESGEQALLLGKYACES